MTAMTEKSSIEKKHLYKHANFTINYYSCLLGFYVVYKVGFQGTGWSGCCLSKISRMKNLLLCGHALKPLNLEISCFRRADFTSEIY